MPSASIACSCLSLLGYLLLLLLPRSWSMDDSTCWRVLAISWRPLAASGTFNLSIDTPRNVFCESGLQSFVAKDDVLSVYVLAEANSTTK